jgi:hypothetical protein
MEESTALGRTAEIDNRYGDVDDLLVPVDGFIEEGVGEGSDYEDDDDTRVAEDTLEFVGEDPPGVC